MSDETPPGSNQAKGPRWTLILAWLGFLWAISGIVQIVLEYAIKSNVGGLTVPVDASDVLFPGLIHFLLGGVLAVFFMRKRLNG